MAGEMTSAGTGAAAAAAAAATVPGSSASAPSTTHVPHWTCRLCAGESPPSELVCPGCGTRNLVSAATQTTTAGEPDVGHPRTAVGDQTVPVHMHVGCDGCGAAPIRGRRFKCQDCDNYDLCQVCVRLPGKHGGEDDEYHTFEEIEAEQSATKSVSRQGAAGTISPDALAAALLAAQQSMLPSQGLPGPRYAAGAGSGGQGASQAAAGDEHDRALDSPTDMPVEESFTFTTFDELATRPDLMNHYKNICRRAIDASEVGRDDPEVIAPLRRAIGTARRMHQLKQAAHGPPPASLTAATSNAVTRGLLASLAMVYSACNRHEEALSHGLACIDECKEMGDTASIFDARITVGCSLAALGRQAEAVPFHQACVANAPRKRRHTAHRYFGVTLFHLYRHAEAAEQFELEYAAEKARFDDGANPRESLQRLLMARESEGEYYFQAGRYADAERVLRRTLEDPRLNVTAVMDASTTGRLHMYHGIALHKLGRFPESLAELRRAKALADAGAGETDFRVAVHVELGHTLTLMGLFDAAVTAFDCAIKTPGGLDARPKLVINAMNGKGVCYIEMRLAAESLDAHDAALDLVRAMVDPADLEYEAQQAACLAGKGNALAMLGRIPEAKACQEERLRLATGPSTLGMRSRALGALASLELREGNLARAEELFKDSMAPTAAALEPVAEEDHYEARLGGLNGLSSVCCTRGDLTGALAHAEAALALCANSRYRSAESALLGDVGHIHLLLALVGGDSAAVDPASDPLPKAIVSFCRSVALLDAMFADAPPDDPVRVQLLERDQAVRLLLVEALSLRSSRLRAAGDSAAAAEDRLSALAVCDNGRARALMAAWTTDNDASSAADAAGVSVGADPGEDGRDGTDRGVAAMATLSQTLLTSIAGAELDSQVFLVFADTRDSGSSQAWVAYRDPAAEVTTTPTASAAEATTRLGGHAGAGPEQAVDPASVHVEQFVVTSAADGGAGPGSSERAPVLVGSRWLRGDVALDEGVSDAADDSEGAEFACPSDSAVDAWRKVMAAARVDAEDEGSDGADTRPDDADAVRPRDVTVGVEAAASTPTADGPAAVSADGNGDGDGDGHGDSDGGGDSDGDGDGGGYGGGDGDGDGCGDGDKLGDSDPGGLHRGKGRERSGGARNDDTARIRAKFDELLKPAVAALLGAKRVLCAPRGGAEAARKLHVVVVPNRAMHSVPWGAVFAQLSSQRGASNRSLFGAVGSVSVAPSVSAYCNAHARDVRIRRTSAAGAGTAGVPHAPIIAWANPSSDLVEAEPESHAARCLVDRAARGVGTGAGLLASASARARAATDASSGSHAAAAATASKPTVSTVLAQDGATVASVVECLGTDGGLEPPAASIAHFACHGSDEGLLMSASGVAAPVSRKHRFVILTASGRINFAATRLVQAYSHHFLGDADARTDASGSAARGGGAASSPPGDDSLRVADRDVADAAAAAPATTMTGDSGARVPNTAFTAAYAAASRRALDHVRRGTYAQMKREVEAMSAFRGTGLRAATDPHPGKTQSRYVARLLGRLDAARNAVVAMSKVLAADARDTADGGGGDSSDAPRGSGGADGSPGGSSSRPRGAGLEDMALFSGSAAAETQWAAVRVCEYLDASRIGKECRGPPLVVMSACDSHVGDVNAEGVMALSRGWLRAGTLSLVATLRPVHTFTSMLFMVRFYWRLFRDTAPAAGRGRGGTSPSMLPRAAEAASGSAGAARDYDAVGARLAAGRVGAALLSTQADCRSMAWASWLQFCQTDVPRSGASWTAFVRGVEYVAAHGTPGIPSMRSGRKPLAEPMHWAHFVVVGV